MGILRLLLAISVVVVHCDADVGASLLVGGAYAVKLFFVISGFYMALILHEKYSAPGATALFYGNRLLRLLPTYYVMVALSVVAVAVLSGIRGHLVSVAPFGLWRDYGSQLPAGLAAALKWVQITPLGQEVPTAGFLDLTTHQVEYTVLPDHPYLVLGSFMVLPPAWTLSLELQFYALAPWLVRRSLALLAGIFLLSLACRWVLPLLPYGNPEFLRDHNLLPQLGHFLLGVAGYRFYRGRETSLWWRRLAGYGVGIWAAVLLLLFLYPWLPVRGREPLVTGSFALALPFIFATTATWSWDRLLGELSYPVYLGHWLVKELWYGLDLKRWSAWLKYDWERAAVVVVGSLILAAAVHQFVERPIDRYRQRRARRFAAAAPVPAP
ncbi:MAG TPA: acyltransferase [Candidatus Limnocylindria bacterium]|nr:acyltransferase [Candidatus Limnocylindria bacterium]